MFFGVLLYICALLCGVCVVLVSPLKRKNVVCFFVLNLRISPSNRKGVHLTVFVKDLGEVRRCCIDVDIIGGHLI